MGPMRFSWSIVGPSPLGAVEFSQGLKTLVTIFADKISMWTSKRRICARRKRAQALGSFE